MPRRVPPVLPATSRLVRHLLSCANSHLRLLLFCPERSFGPAASSLHRALRLGAAPAPSQFHVTSRAGPLHYPCPCDTRASAAFSSPPSHDLPDALQPSLPAPLPPPPTPPRAPQPSTQWRRARLCAPSGLPQPAPTPPPQSQLLPSSSLLYHQQNSRFSALPRAAVPALAPPRAPARTVLAWPPPPASHPGDSRRAGCGYPSLACRPFSSLLTDFGALGVSPELRDRLAAQGLQSALPVQAAALPLILSGRNTAIKSCTGSGKTLAYLLPVLQLALERRRAAMAAAVAAAATSCSRSAAAAASNSNHGVSGGGGSGTVGGSGSSSGRGDVERRPTAAELKQRARSPQAIIVAPSRELCIQIQRTAQDLMPGPPANRRLVQQLIGGANPRRQEAALAGGGGDGYGAGSRPLVVVGTPGRVADMVTRGSLHVWECPLLVLDEADQLFVQDELRQHVDVLAAHVGRRVSQPPPLSLPHPRYAAADDGVDAAAASSGGGRQTVILSASLDARDPCRYASWCPDAAFVVLESLQALPPPPPHPHHQQTKDRRDAEAAATATAAGTGLEQQHSAAGTSARRTASTCDSTTTSTTGSAPAPAIPNTTTTNPAAAAPLSGVLSPHLAHAYLLSPSKHRTDRVRRLIHALGAERVLLFVNKQNQTMVTKYRLEARRMEVTVLHGRLSKLERGNIMAAFRRGVFRTLVVTDLGARGLDLPDCDAVINFGPPADALAYAHRAGRTGRAGAAGVVTSVVTRLELPALQRIAAQLGIKLQAVSVSHGMIAPGEAEESSGQADGGSIDGHAGA